MYITKMSAGKMNTEAGRKIIEQRHTRGEIISRAEELLVKELCQELADYAGLQEACTRGKAGEDTIYGFVDRVGNKVDFTNDMKLKAAVAVLSVNGHFFEATPVS
jgi:hypothetical protein